STSNWALEHWVGRKMAISSADIRGWITQGAQDAASNTYASVKRALEQGPVGALSPDIFLQGSYANQTNTRGDSDVDIVVALRSTFHSDTTTLGSSERARYEADTSPATTSSDTFRQMVEQALVGYYGPSRVHSKDKCIRVDKRDGYVDADIVPAVAYRRYESFPAYGDPVYLEGIALRPLSGGMIVNFPKQHRKNGSQKNDRCSGLYTPSVRQLTRLRRRAVDLGLLSRDDAPGYVLECVTYNVPISEFLRDDVDRLIAISAWLSRRTPDDLRGFDSCDEVHKLFIDDPGKHNEYTAKRVLDTLWELL
ncbi:MAG TPA: nucleotidyltransferase, partial [Bryobacteraceae bacterium]